MKKSLISALLLAGMSSAASAGSFYIGLGAAAGTGEEEMDISTSSASASDTFDYDTSSAELKLGYQTDSFNRWELSFNSLTADADGEEQDFPGMDIDFYGTFGTADLKPFLGAGLGFYTYDGLEEFTVDNEDVNGLALNLTGGVFWTIADHFDLEASYEYKVISWETLKSGSTEIELSEAIGQFQLGFRYIF